MLFSVYLFVFCLILLIVFDCLNCVVVWLLDVPMFVLLFVFVLLCVFVVVLFSLCVVVGFGCCVFLFWIGECSNLWVVLMFEWVDCFCLFLDGCVECSMFWFAELMIFELLKLWMLECVIVLCLNVWLFIVNMLCCLYVFECLIVWVCLTFWSFALWVLNVWCVDVWRVIFCVNVWLCWFVYFSRLFVLRCCSFCVELWMFEYLMCYVVLVIDVSCRVELLYVFWVCVNVLCLLFDCLNDIIVKWLNVWFFSFCYYYLLMCYVCAFVFDIFICLSVVLFVVNEF